MAKRRKPLAKFRVYSFRSVLFFHVFIWATLKDLRAEYDSNKGNKFSSRGVEAFCRPVSRYRIIGDKHRITPKVGEIHLSLKHLTTGRISHESTHAAIKVFNRLGIDFRCLDCGSEKNQVYITKYINGEEFFCYTVDNFTKQIVDRIYKLRLLVEGKRK